MLKSSHYVAVVVSPYLKHHVNYGSIVDKLDVLALDTFLLIFI